ncbi:MAG: hypothetical protein WDW38_002054 [Sanguina aurantia]
MAGASPPARYLTPGGNDSHDLDATIDSSFNSDEYDDELDKSHEPASGSLPHRATTATPPRATTPTAAGGQPPLTAAQQAAAAAYLASMEKDSDDEGLSQEHFDDDHDHDDRFDGAVHTTPPPPLTDVPSPLQRLQTSPALLNSADTIVPGISITTTTTPAPGRGAGSNALAVGHAGGTALDVDFHPGAPTHSPGSPTPRAQFHSHVPRNVLRQQAEDALPVTVFDAALLQGNLDTKTGIEVPSPLQLFVMYDVDYTGALTLDEFKQLLLDLDGLRAMPAKDVDAYVGREFHRADMNHDHHLSLDEFYHYYYSTLCFKFPILRSGVNPGADLFNIFAKYCSVGQSGGRNEEMGMYQFIKLCTDCKLINGKSVTRAALGIIYSRARAEDACLEPGLRVCSCSRACKHTCRTPKLFYPQFLFALQLIAVKRRTGFQEVVSKILNGTSSTAGPSISDFLVFVNNGTAEEAEEYLERPRGLPRLPRDTNTANIARMEYEASQVETYKRSFAKKHADAAAAPVPPAVPVATEGAGLSSVYSSNPHTTTNGSASARLSNSTTSVFPPSTAIPPPASIPTPKQQQQQALAPLLAQPPVMMMGQHGAVPDRPEGLGSTGMGSTLRNKWGLGEVGEVRLSRTGVAALTDPLVMFEVRQVHPDALMMGLKRVYERYCSWHNGMNREAMDKARFQKALRDVQLISEGGALSLQTAGKIFSKVVPGSSKTMNFIQFVESLRHVANTCRLSINEVMERLVVVWGPERQGPESASANTPDVLLTETFARSSRGFNTDVDGQPDGRLMFGNAMSQMASGHQTFSVVADSAQSSGALVPAWPFTA